MGEKTPELMNIETLAMETGDYQDFWQVKVNDRWIDLAYIFIDSGVDDNLINLAAVSNCLATRVSPVLPK